MLKRYLGKFFLLENKQLIKLARSYLECFQTCLESLEEFEMRSKLKK